MSDGMPPQQTTGSGRSVHPPQVSRLPAQLYAARLRARARWRRLAVTAAVCLTLIAVAVYVVVWHTSTFAVTAVRVVAQQGVPTQRVLAMAALQNGTPLASIDTAAVAGRVEQVKQVASARVSLDWPHTVIITLTVRTAAALIPDGGGYDVVDSSGVVFGTTPTATRGLPVIEVDGGPGVQAAVVPGALAALRALPADVGGRVIGVAATSAYSITLKLTKGITVIWGGGEDAQAKAADLTALIRARKANRYDVSAPGAPAMS